jgi:ABC-type branched-subunit amino acid transport system ATPase component/ABC-type branched-subunit amino acid transport system permease subunit
MRPDARRRLWFFLLLALPFVLRDELTQFALARVAAFAAAATGLAVVSGLAGQISLGHAGLMAAGAYTSAGLAVHAGWPFAASWVAGTALAAAVGLAFGVPSLRVRRQYLALATLGGGFIIWQIVRETGSLTGSDFGLAGVPPPSAFGHAFGPLGSAVLGLGVLAVALFAAGNITGARAGRAFRAVRDGETGAQASGISIFSTKLSAFVFSAAVAGAAGGLFAHAEGFIAPGQFDPRVSFTLLLAAVLGGLASPYGGALGALLILGPSELFPSAFDWLEQYQIVAWGPVALLVVFRWPDGVAGAVSRLVRRFRPGQRPGAADAEASEPPALHPSGVAAGEALLVVRGLGKSFGGLRALHDVSMGVRAGTIHALIGPNGSGKTTLLDCVTGALRYSDGEIALAGRGLGGLAPNEVAGLGVARTFQQVALFGSMTAEENVLTGAHLRTRGGVVLGAAGLAVPGEPDARREAGGLLAAVGLGGKGDDLAQALSYGQRKRLELARALALHPRLLLLDEPAAGRNEPEILELGRFLKRLRAAGLTILLVEHHMNFVLSLADTVTVLDEGRVVAEGPPSQVRTDPAVVEAYLGAAGA